jgi:hypothetical protein
VIAIVGVFLDAIQTISYWELDGTIAWTGLAFGGLALLLVVVGYAGAGLDGWLFAVGAALVGFWAWFPAVSAFDGWDETGAGMWLCLGGAVLIALGAATSLSLAGLVATTPGGISFPTVVSGVGIALVFPAIFLDAQQSASYWDGDGLGILMLVVAALCALAWDAWARRRADARPARPRRLQPDRPGVQRPPRHRGGWVARAGRRHPRCGRHLVGARGGGAARRDRAGVTGVWAVSRPPTPDPVATPWRPCSPRTG